MGLDCVYVTFKNYIHSIVIERGYLVRGRMFIIQIVMFYALSGSLVVDHSGVYDNQR